MYWKLPIMFSVFSFSIDFDSSPEIVPKAPKKIGVITVFTLNCLLTSAAKSVYSSIFSPMIHWDLKIHIVPRVLLPIRYYNIWPIITHFPIILYWLVSVDCYFAIICLCYNIEYMVAPLVSCRDPMLLE